MVQSIIGTFLYYGCAVDPTILPALNELSTQQAAQMKRTLEHMSMLMEYLHTYPNAVFGYLAGTMQLAVDSDVAYLVMPAA